MTELKNRSRPFPIVVAFEDADALQELLSVKAGR